VAFNYVVRPLGIQSCFDMAQVMNIVVYGIIVMAMTSQLDADKWSGF
jgi:hypothetical protein